MIEPMTSTINCDRNADATEAPSDEAGTAFTSTPLRTPTVSGLEQHPSFKVVARTRRKQLLELRTPVKQTRRKMKQRFQ